MSEPAGGPAEQRFGPFSYDPEQRLLFRDGKPVPLVPKLADTLHVLLERRGRVVEKAELLRLVWPDAVVEESGLARNISLLRKALGDESEQYIQTVPKRGYRFAAAEPEQNQRSLPGPRRRPRLIWLLVAPLVGGILGVMYWQFFLPGPLVPKGPSGVNIVVLRFQSIPPENPALSQSFDETLIAALAQIPTVRVLSPSTVGRYRDARVPPHIMARVLGMDAILEGTVQFDADHLRVTARPSDVHSAGSSGRNAMTGWPGRVNRSRFLLPEVSPKTSRLIWRFRKPLVGLCPAASKFPKRK